MKYFSGEYQLLLYVQALRGFSIYLDSSRAQSILQNTVRAALSQAFNDTTQRCSALLHQKRDGGVYHQIAPHTQLACRGERGAPHYYYVCIFTPSRKEVYSIV